MKYALLILATIAFCSCSGNKEFINHTLTYEKSGECGGGEKPINMLSNIAGERYEFQSCLSADFDGKEYSVERKGDSIVVNLKRHGGIMAEFKITLDIDASPVYHHIILDGKEILVNQQQLLDTK